MILPNSKEIEQSYLGCILIDNEVLLKAPVSKEVFYYPEHKEIYEEMLKVKPIDINTLSKFSASLLAGFMNSVVSTTSAEKYAKILKEKYQRRFLIQKFSGIELDNEDRDLVEIVNSIKKDLVEINSEAKLENNPDLADNWYEDYDKVSKPEIFTGMPKIDASFGGFVGTEFVIIPAKTGLGKTNLMANWALSMAKSGKKVLFYSLEMSTNEIMNRFIAITGNHRAFDIYTRAEQKDLLHGTIQKFKEYPITLISQAGITSQDVISQAYNLKLKGEVDVVMIDYLQRLRDKGGENETTRLTNIARNLKDFALNNNIPVITPVQIDKQSSKSNKVEVENVSGAKSIADEANIVFYLHEKEIKRDSITQEQEFELHLKIAKSRNSQKNVDFKIDFNKNNLKMTEYEDDVPTRDIEEVF